MSISIGRILRIAVATAPLALSGVAFAQAGSGGGGTNPNVDTGGTADTHQQKGATGRAGERATPPSGNTRDQASPPPSGNPPGDNVPNIAPSDRTPSGNPPSDQTPGGPADSPRPPR
jgi:hypothetical protein